MMRLWNSLQFKISVSLFLVGAILIGISALRLDARTKESRKAAMKAMAFAEASRLSGMAQHLLRRKVSRAADLELSYSSTNKDLRLGVVVDGEDTILHATMQHMRGMKLAETPLASIRPILAIVRDSMEGRVEEIEPERRLVVVFPFWEGQAQGKGSIILEYDMEAAMTLASALALHALLAQSLGLMGGCLALWLLLKRVVTDRVETLVSQVQGMSLESEPTEAMRGKDELAQVSKAVRLTHDRLRHSEQRLRQIADTMRDVFWVAPANAENELFVNEAYTAVFRLEKTTLKASRWDWLRSIVKEDRRRCLDMLRALRRGGPRQEVEVRLIAADGILRWVRCRGFAVPDSASPDSPEKAYAVAGIAMDISERKMLERRLLDTAEKERRRIGMDLHDDLCQRLAAALMKTGVLQSALSRTGSGQEPLATELANDLSEATGIARGFARGLAPVGIEALGLPAALSDLGDFITHGFKIPCRVECSASETDLSGETATHIFRVAQELVTNAAKHARASWVEISFEITRHEGRLLISHDGESYNPTLTSASEGMGMHLVRQRLDALGASLTYHPPSLGDDEPFSSVECLIPLSENQDPPQLL